MVDSRVISKLASLVLMIELKKKDKESTLSLLRRFTKKIRQSGVLMRSRRQMFYHKPPTKRQQKISARRRQELRELRSQLIKLGELEPGQKIDLGKIKKKR